eukprot:scaffold123219_cov57-Phaeocystis_antarctica.AAC.1
MRGHASETQGSLRLAQGPQRLLSRPAAQRHNSAAQLRQKGQRAVAKKPVFLRFRVKRRLPAVSSNNAPRIAGWRSLSIAGCRRSKEAVARSEQKFGFGVVTLRVRKPGSLSSGSAQAWYAHTGERKYRKAARHETEAEDDDYAAGAFRMGCGPP